MFESIRAYALALPEAAEAPHFEKLSFRVRGKIFATVPPERTHVHIFLDEHAARTLALSSPDAFSELTWGQRVVGVRVELARAERSFVCELIADAWRRVAPKSLSATYDPDIAGG